MPKSCVVRNCTSSRTNEKRSFFSVPKDEILREKLKVSIPVVTTLRLNHFVCEKHFEEQCIIKEYIKYDSNGRIIAQVPLKHARLQQGAIPTIFDVNLDLRCRSPARGRTPGTFAKNEMDHSYALQECFSDSAILKEMDAAVSIYRNSDENIDHGIMNTQQNKMQCSSNANLQPRVNAESINSMDLYCNTNTADCNFGIHTDSIPNTTVKEMDAAVNIYRNSDENADHCSIMNDQQNQIQCSVNANLQSKVNIEKDPVETCIENIICISIICIEQTNYMYFYCNTDTADCDFGIHIDNEVLQNNLQNDLQCCSNDTLNTTFIKNSAEDIESINAKCPSTAVTFDAVTFNFDAHPFDAVFGNHCSLQLCKPWNVCKIISDKNEPLAFTYFIKINDCGIDRYIVEKTVIIKRSRQITYEIYSTPVDTTGTNKKFG